MSRFSKIFKRFGEENREDLLDKEAFEKLFNTEEGKRVLNVLYRECMPLIGEFESDARKAAYNEGKIAMFLFILKLVSIPKEAFFAPILKQYVVEQEKQLEQEAL